MNSPLPENLIESAVYENIAASLSAESYCVIDSVLPEAAASDIFERIRELKSEDSLRRAGIGRQNKYHVNNGVRKDHIRWINWNNSSPALDPLLTRLRSLRLYLNRSCFLNLRDIELHYAYYPPGAFYRKHRDRFKQNPHRVVSCIYYLNPVWQTTDGGLLNIYLNDRVVLVEPVFNRLAVFLSELEHEVSQSASDRFSITAWMLDCPQELTSFKLN